MNKELENAVLLGNLKDIKTLIKNGCNLDAKDKYGRSVIFDAIIKDYNDIVLELCNAKADVNIKDKSGKTPLHFTAIHSRYEIANTLIQNGADLNAKDINGNTPIFDAVFNAYDDNRLILLLLNKGADPNLKNNYGISPKEIAETSDNFKFPNIFGNG